MDSFKNCYTFFILLFLANLQLFAQGTSPVLTAGGNQVYCPGTGGMNIVTSFNIADAQSINALYFQISEGYYSNQDKLQQIITSSILTQAVWDPVTATLKVELLGGGTMSLSDILFIVNNVQYVNTSDNPTPGVRRFSITIGDAGYLPSTGHYYRFIAQNGITWEAARQAAANSNYFGLQGYLATITSAEEAQFAGEQTRVTGWIGGSDSQQEGVWRWMTGPEAGTVFWNGGPTGWSPTYAFWNNSEPNNVDGGEHYAHITARNIGIPGAWNDLPNHGGTGDYAPKGYIVEYGGMPGDPILSIAAYTTITIASITAIQEATLCGTGSATIGASSSSNAVYWYTGPTGGSPIHTGQTFTTPVLTATTTYYISAHDNACTAGGRTPVTVTVNQQPTITTSAAQMICGPGTATLQATASAGTIVWYDAPSGGNQIGTGQTIISPHITATTTFYAEAVNNGCTSSARASVTVTVNAPIPVSDETVYKCQGQTITLNAGITGVTYLWSVNNQITQSISVSAGGTYSVVLTNAQNCSATKTFTVIERVAPVIEGIDVNDTTVIVNLSNPGSGNYEYSIDGVNFQQSNVFTNVPPGVGEITVKESNHCGIAKGRFVVFVVPKFFTPNGDNVNDLFTIQGITQYPKARISIFDRYGKLLVQLTKNKPFWDGTFDNRHLPASDYWYIIKLDDNTPEIKGHFALIR